VETALREHARLVELIRKRSGQQAEEAWRKHLSESARCPGGQGHGHRGKAAVLGN